MTLQSCQNSAIKNLHLLYALLLSIPLLFASACGGGGAGGGGTPPPSNPTITSVTVSCSPGSVSTAQTSTCSATVTGTGSYSSAVSWTATLGTITSAGVFTATATGTATITATSTADITKSGSASVMVPNNPAPSVTGLVPSSVIVGATSTVITVSGTGFMGQTSAALDGTPLSTTFSSPSSIQATVPASMLNSAQFHLITVTNPTPGGGTSANIGPWTSTGAMTTARESHTQTLLQNGKVLIAGGGWFSGLLSNVSANADIYDPAGRNFVATGTMASPRAFHTATLLNNGKVLVAGGSSAAVNGSPSMGALASAELYDPSTGTFSATGSMTDSRMYQSATLLGNGNVLIVGGTDSSGNVLSSAELYNPATGTFTATGTMSAPRFGHTATLLPSGKVLIAGGESVSSNAVVDLNSAELYDPTTGLFTLTGSLLVGRESATATLLNSGNVLIAGGYEYPAGFLQEAELYNSSTGTFSATGSMGTPRNLHSAVLLADGTVLVMGGSDGSSAQASAEIYTLTTGKFTPTWTMSTARAFFEATALSDGSVLVSGGEGNQGATAPLSSAEVYPPPSSSAAAAASEFTVENPVPSISSLSATSAPSGSQVTITGNNFETSSEVLLNGLAVTSYGDPSTPNQIWIYPGDVGSYSVAVNNPSPGGGVSNTATLTVTVGVQITPVRALWPEGSTNPFSATVSGTSNTNVIWSVQEGTAGGSITSSGVYTAPSTPGTYHIVATSDADQTQSATATVIVGPGAGHVAFGSQMTTQREENTATLLNNAKVLLAGGSSNLSAELYDQSSGIFSPTGSTTFSPNVATLLPSGKVLLAGKSTATVYDPATGGFSLTGSMMSPTRDVGSLTLLQSGKVLVLGGDATAELYDPATGSFSFTGSMATARWYGFTATLLSNGKVLVAGGDDPSYNDLSSAELYDPIAGTFSPTGNMTVSKSQAKAVLLSNGKVLIVGGDWSSYSAGGPAELYDPSSGKFTETSTPPVYPLNGLLAGTLLPNGLVFIGGGILDNGTATAPFSDRTQFYDPSSETFYAGPLLNDSLGNTIAFTQNAMTPLPNGTVLIAGFFGSQDTDIYTPGATNPLPAVASGIQKSTISHFQSSGIMSRLPTIQAP